MTTPWIETRDRLLAGLAESQEKLCSLLASAADEQDWRPASGEWSFRQIAAHLATSERECLAERLRRIASGEQPYFEGYHNTGRDFGDVDLRRSLQEWTYTRDYRQVRFR